MKHTGSLKQRYLEALGATSLSLSLSNISRFYYNYVNSNYMKVRSELERVGYFVLKNKVSIGNSSATTKDIQISTYFVNMNMVNTVNSALSQRYHTPINVRDMGGFFMPSTNELAVFIRVNDLDNIAESIKESDVRSTIEHELTHAFDNTNKNSAVSKQSTVPGIGSAFLSACSYLGCATRSDIATILSDGLFVGKDIESCIFSISALLYKLFTITEFNAHQFSDLSETHNVNYNRSDSVKKALQKDIVTDSKITYTLKEDATSVTADECPYLWKLVGNVLSYMGYKVNKNSPSAVYKFFSKMSDKLYAKYIEKKVKNQTKTIISIKEKNSIKSNIKRCIENNKLSSGATFWFSPSGSRDSYLCRFRVNGSSIELYVNRNKIKIYGNANEMLKRITAAYSSGNESAMDFALDNLVDIIVQSIERSFKNASYDPVYDITTPQDEDQISVSNKISSRFADLDWD